MESYWYALQSKPRAEERLYGYASVKGFELFYPRLAVKRVNPHARGFEPYFIGYLFVHTDLDAVGLCTFQRMPFALGLVCFGSQLAAVSAALIHAPRWRLKAENASGGRMSALRRGDTLSIVEGPFAGYEALFDSELAGGVAGTCIAALAERSLPGGGVTCRSDFAKTPSALSPARLTPGGAPHL